jgi:colicin import membrane protein
MQFRMASVISAGLHAAVLLWALLTFTSAPFKVTPAESLPIDLVSEKEFSELAKGQKDAPKIKIPKPLVEQLDESKSVEDSKAKVDKKEVKAAHDATPPPEPKPQKEQPAKAKAEPPPKIDPIGEKIKQDSKQQVVKNEPMPPHRPPVPHYEPKFDADKIAALLDKRAPTRTAATGADLNDDPAVGYVHGLSAQLSQDEIAALKRRITECWNVPAGAKDAQNLAVIFRVMFRQDGTVERGPVLVGASPGSPFGPAFADSGKRAILQCQPYTMLKPEHYKTWRDIEIEFRPQDLGG